MKKLLVVLLALTALSVAAFADDVVWTWGLTVKTGAQITLGDSTSTPDALIVARDADDPTLSRARFDAEAGLGDFSAHVRFNSDFGGGFDPTSLTPMLISNWWVNSYFLNKMVQVQFGITDHSVTDTVNKGWGGINVTGAQFVVVPMEGLSIGLALPVPVASATVAKAWAGMKVGAAYTMPNLLTFKATYMNAAGDKLSDFAAGVDVLAIPNLTAQLELQGVDFGNTATGEIDIFENVAYLMGALKPALALTETLWSASGLNMTIVVNPSVDYAVMTGTNVGLGVTYTMNAAGGSTSSLNVDPYVKFTLNPKATVKIDAAYKINDMSATSTWSLPININLMYSF